MAQNILFTLLNQSGVECICTPDDDFKEVRRDICFVYRSLLKAVCAAKLPDDMFSEHNLEKGPNLKSQFAVNYAFQDFGTNSVKFEPAFSMQ